MDMWASMKFWPPRVPPPPPPHFGLKKLQKEEKPAGQEKKMAAPNPLAKGLDLPLISCEILLALI